MGSLDPERGVVRVQYGVGLRPSFSSGDCCTTRRMSAQHKFELESVGLVLGGPAAVPLHPMCSSSSPAAMNSSTSHRPAGAMNSSTSHRWAVASTLGMRRLSSPRPRSLMFHRFAPRPSTKSSADTLRIRENRRLGAAWCTSCSRAAECCASCSERRCAQHVR